MPEHQEIEWKESWRDEYLKWLCGYANAHGGTLIIGKDDDGKVVGIQDSKKLLEDLPNKITNVFFVSGMIEAWGRGFDKIRAACDALYHTPVPEYDITAEGIMVHCKANQRYLELSGQEWVKTDGPIMSQFREDEMPFVREILKLIDQNGCVKNADVKAMMGKSPATAKRLLTKMVSAHLIAREGNGRGQRYVKWVK